MKKSKSLSCLEQGRKISQLIQKVGRTPDKAGQHCCRVDETKTCASLRESTSFVENASRPNSPRNQRNLRLKISVNLCESVSNFLCLSRRKLAEGGCLSVLVAETQLVRRSLLVRHSFPVLRSFSEGGSDGGGEGGSIKNNKLCETNPISKKVKCL
jgi:hypothetical protein